MDYDYSRIHPPPLHVYHLKKVTYVIALVSANISPFSSANLFASSYVTSRVLSKSDLFPIKNITVLGFVKFLVSVSQLERWL